MTRWNVPHWVYRVFDAEGRLLYVGMTWKPGRRMTDWRKVAKRTGDDHWFTSAHRVAWCLYPSKLQAMWAERAAIQCERPLHNILMAAPA